MKTTSVCMHIAFSLAMIPLFMQCAAKKELASLQAAQQKQQQELNEAQQRNQSLSEQITVLEQQVSRLRAENSSLQRDLSTAQATAAELSEQLSNCPEAMVEGVVFKVQIGAFRERDLEEDLDTSVNLEVDSTNDMDKMVVGQFRDYYQADQLQKQLRAMGVETAWIVPYRDGERVSLEEVLPQVETEP